MTAVLATPGPVTAGPGAPQDRRGRAALLVAAVLALTGLLATGVLAAPSTVDLAAGPSSFGGDADVVTVPEFGERGTHVVDYRYGAGLAVTVPLRNDGPLPVEVTSVATGAGILPLLEVRSVEGLPLSLGPGEQGEVVVQAVLANCAYYHEREVQNVRELLVGLDVGVGPLTRGTTVSVPLDRPLLVHSPMIVGCPDRKLNRQADDRNDAL